MTTLAEDLQGRVRELTCPECVASGMPAEEAHFGTAQALGSHRRRSHGVVGVSAASRRRPGRPAKKKARGGAARNLRREPSTPALAEAPRGLSDREYAAFRLGSLRTLTAAFGQRLERPPELVASALEGEIGYLEYVLASEAE